MFQPLIGMPSSEALNAERTDEEEADEMSESMSPPGSPYRQQLRSRPGSVNSRVSNRTGSVMSRPNSGVNGQGHYMRPGSSTVAPGSRNRQAGGQKLTGLQRSNVVSCYIGTLTLK